MALALLGGRPAFEQPVAVGTPFAEAATRRRYLELLEGVFQRNWLTNDGPLLRQLEQELASLHRVRHCVLVCNATMGQVLLLRALDLAEGDVVVPSFTFVATVHACVWQGLRPVFCDVSPRTLMAGPEEVERVLTPRTRAVVGVHLFGNVSDAAGLAAVCARHGTELLFDAAHGFGCTRGEVPVGGFGRAEILSLHATKAFSTFEGGAILTNDEALDARLRALRNFGFRGYDDVASLGLNAKLPEASAAFGLASLPEIECRRGVCRQIYEGYRERLSALPGIEVVEVGRDGRSNFHYVPVRVQEEAFGLSRDLLHRTLWAENVLARRYFHPGVHRMAAYASLPRAALPVTEAACDEILCLPSGFADPDATVARVVALMAEARSEARRLRELEAGVR